MTRRKEPRPCKACRDAGIVVYVATGGRREDEHPPVDPTWMLGEIRGAGFRLCSVCKGGGYDPRDRPIPEGGWPVGELQLTAWLWLQLVELDKANDIRPFTGETFKGIAQRRLAQALELRTFRETMGFVCKKCRSKLWTMHDGQAFVLKECQLCMALQLPSRLKLEVT
jgi:hypothetical protein